MMKINFFNSVFSWEVRCGYKPHLPAWGGKPGAVTNRTYQPGEDQPGEDQPGGKLNKGVVSQKTENALW